MQNHTSQNVQSHHFMLRLAEGWTAFVIFYCAPAIVYYGLITGFNFSFFEPDFAWNAYNQYFLSMLDGRLDIPPDSIGREGSYLGGKAYMYYGAFPIITRLMMFPFVDLDVTPISRLSIWVFSVAAVSVLQWRILTTFRHFADGQGLMLKFAFLCLASLILWFASAHTVIIRSATLYHEPYAASLLLVAVYLAVASRDLMFNTGERRYRLVIYASIAALSLYTRPTIAISLYAATLFLIGAAVVEEAISSAVSNKERFGSYLKILIRKGAMPTLILAGGGCVLLGMNYARFGNPFSLSGGGYGFAVSGEGFTERACSGMLGHSRFDLLRIIPNTIYYLIGGNDIHTKLSMLLDTGFVRREPPIVRMVFLWTTGIAAAAFFVWINFLSALKRNARAIILSGLFLSLMIATLLQLSYTTITYRYMADLWPPMGMSLLFTWHYFSTRKIDTTSRSVKFMTAGLFLAVVMNIAYGMYSYNAYRHQFPTAGNFFEGSNNIGLKKYLSGTQTPGGSRPGDPSECEKYDWWPKK